MWESLSFTFHLVWVRDLGICRLAGLSHGRRTKAAAAGVRAWLLCVVCRSELGSSPLHGKNFAGWDFHHVLRPSPVLPRLCQAPAPAPCFLCWQWFKGLIQEQLWHSKPPGVLFLSPNLVGYQFLPPLYQNTFFFFYLSRIGLFENLIFSGNILLICCIYLTYFLFVRCHRNGVQHEDSWIPLFKWSLRARSLLCLLLSFLDSHMWYRRGHHWFVYCSWESREPRTIRQIQYTWWILKLWRS